ncbi:glycosyltransferase 87 family protein [Pontibacter sp. G13]|uniref:glycosyltransferase 87 family protein n=1 Tax=Pontibacter sp. G13 TaxID=3074898 RepID=UPI00288A440C|nr:glycosyltransferase 87 family protein [Pontibacter sp. G13]WNJ18483.1 glycosyltransferase 87 family protein [Pontibacter sp. G13]
MTRFSWRHIRIWHICLLTVAIRMLIWMTIYHPDGYSHLTRDDGVYQLAMEELKAGQLLSSIKIMPGYPAILVLVGGFPNVIYFNWLLSALGCWLLYSWTSSISHALGRDRAHQAGVWAAIGYACWPTLIYFSDHAYTEVPFTTCLIAIVWCWHHRYFWQGSMIAVLSILIRPTLDILAPLLLLSYLLVHRSPRRTIFMEMGKYVFIYLLFLAPWWWHNTQKYDQFVRLNHGMGEVWYHGQVNVPSDTTGIWVGDHLYDLGIYADIPDPIQRDQALREAVMQHFAEHPIDLLRAPLLNLRKFWLGPSEVFWGLRGWIVWGLSLALVMLFAWALVGWLRMSNRGILWFPILLTILYFSGVHAFLHGEPRYRIPIDPLLMGWVAYSVSRWLDQRKASGV